MPPRAANGRLTPICLCCFGRGGSSIVWNMLGSSPDAVVMRREWHQAVFAGADGLRRALRWINRRGWLRTAPPVLTAPLARAAALRVVSDMRSEDMAAKPGADAVVIKLMDHNLWRLPLIAQGFGSIRPVILTRDPLAQCESLMRSGLSVEVAADWYRDVAEAMVWIRDRYAAPVFRFEDLVEQPDDFAQRLFPALSLAAPRDYRLKKKRYGTARDPIHRDVTGTHIIIPASGLRDFIDPKVNVESIERLGPDQRGLIAKATAIPARSLGYAQ